MTYRGHVENGIVVLDTPIPLPEGATVTVVIDTPSEADPAHTLTTLAQEMQAEVPEEAWDSLPVDGASNVDHYLYDAAKNR